VSGFVVQKNVLQGQRVMAGDALYRLADLRSVWVEGDVFERDLSAVRLAQVVTAELDALPGRTRRGRITYIQPTLDPDTRTSRVRVELANHDLELKPGMYATLRWPGRGAASVLTVPRSAVIATGARTLVFLKRGDGMLEPRLVTVGSATADRIEILSGLSPGDTVVASATFLLDAESNLGALFGGMGNMPGMDMTTPSVKREEPNAHTNH
jgi:membrane fusion protein, copper/silver efflux system